MRFLGGVGEASHLEEGFHRQDAKQEACAAALSLDYTVSMSSREGSHSIDVEAD